VRTRTKTVSKFPQLRRIMSQASISDIPTASTRDQEVLVKVEGVSKKFCRSLKRSLWYGVCDIAGELSPFGRRPQVAGCGLLVAGNGRHQDASELATTNQPLVTSPPLRDGEFWAVNDVSFELRRGECLGLIGHNGAGKTTLLKMLNGLIKPDAGRIEMNGRVGALIALGAGFNPILTGRENIYINGSVLGLSKNEIDEKIDEIIGFAEIGEFIDMPVQNYSSGMQVRLGFAVATALKPDILLLDEVLAVGDASFRAKCFERIGRILRDSAVIFVSHSEAQVQRICNRGLWIKNGAIEAQGEVCSILAAYRDDQQDVLSLSNEWIKAPIVKSVQVREKHQSLESAQSFILVIEIVCSGDITVSHCYCQWHKVGEAVAQAYLTDSCLGRVPLRQGLNKLQLTIESVPLAKGIYDVSFACFTNNGKETLVHSLSAARVTVNGPIGAGPAVQMPATLQLLPTL
jgi:lipopolysaccharide transport system ATP-binding protein